MTFIFVWYILWCVLTCSDRSGLRVIVHVSRDMLVPKNYFILHKIFTCVTGFVAAALEFVHVSRVWLQRRSGASRLRNESRRSSVASRNLKDRRVSIGLRPSRTDPSSLLQLSTARATPVTSNFRQVCFGKIKIIKN